MSSGDRHSPGLKRRRSIRTRLLALLLALTVIPMLAVGYLGVDSVRSVGGKAQQLSAGALRDQAEQYLRETTTSDARANDLILERAQRDALKIAQYAANVFANPDVFATGSYWRAEERMRLGEDGQYSNSEDDPSSAFVPNFVEIDEGLLGALETSAYLDFVLGSTFESDPNTAAIYLGTEHEITYYYPNIGLGDVLPPDWRVTERPWYVGAGPANNPRQEVIWTPIYLDATGKGLMVTAAAPVYAGEDEFIGAVGVDVTLQDMTASIEETRVLGSGYAFLLDDEGRAVALPERGYRDVLGRDAEPDEVGPKLLGTATAFAPLLERMIAGGAGFDALEVGDRELFVAYTPLESTGWSIANVVEADAILEVIPALEQELEASTRSLAVRRILPVGVGVLLAAAAVGFLLAYRLTVPIREMAEAVQRVGAGDWDVPLPTARADEIGILAQAFDQMTHQLRELYSSLEDRVAARTRDLQQRSVQLEAASHVAREAAGIREVEQLLTETVHLISDRFGFYHAGIFLIDEPGRYAVLQAASSKGGERMLARKHRLKVAEEGIVGYVAGSGEPRIALDVGEDAVFFDNPDLPQTRSEMALPLKVRDRVIGVLDVQSTESGAFSEEDVAVLQTMADQVALAIENARLLGEAEERIQEIHSLLRRESREGWNHMTRARPGWRYVYGTGGPTHGADESPADDGDRLSLPLRVRDVVVGKVDLKLDERSPTPEERTLVGEVLDQAGQALEGARLFEEARARAREQSVLSDLGGALSARLDVDEILVAAHQGAAQLIDARNFYVGLYDPQSEQIHIRFNATSGERDREVTVLSADEGLSGYVVRTGKPVLIRENVAERLSELGVELIGEPALSWLGVPMAVGGEILGVVAVQSYSSPGAYDEHDMELLTAVANQTAIAVQSARLYEEAVETAERLREVDRLKSQFLANMSHELRTPLNSIIGFSRVVLKGIDGPLTERQREDLEAIHNSGQHLLGLINDILDVSKIEAGKMELNFETVDVREIVKGVMSTAVALVKDKPIELRQSIAQDLPPITADERRVRQVLLNLVSNAAKFTQEGFVRVQARAEGDEVVMSVSDTGPGIPQAQQDDIFEPFTQVDGSSTREYGGTGLGLTISHSFVQLHSGRMWVESEPGEGSSFHFALPIAGPPLDDERVEAPVGDPGLPAAESPPDAKDDSLILCVDDDTDVIDLYRRYLHMRGYRVFGLADASRVMDVARRLQPYAITLDIMMPEKDGWEVIQELKTDPQTRDIPVVICSIVSEKERGISLGAAEYLVKPIIEEDLLTALDRLNRESGDHEILVVDDHADDRALLRRMIEDRERYEVVEAAGGAEAIALVKDRHPHIIILDLMMPDVDGFAVLEAVKSDEVTRSIPVIVVTAKDLTQEDRQRLSHRVEALVEKGVLDQEELLEDVAAALRKLRQGP